MGAYQETYDRWRADPEAFWDAAARAIEWDRPPDAVLDRTRAPLYDWFPGGRLNTCANALDRRRNLPAKKRAWERLIALYG